MTTEVSELRYVLAIVLHQLSTDSDLDELVTAPQKYDELEAMVRRVLDGDPL